jgi:SAM-dependent methyltransferase
MTDKPDWRAINRARWDEAVGIHLGPGGYDLSDLRAGQGQMNAIEEDELGPVAGRRVLHLQCHFGRDTLILAQRGATVVGLDFSAPAIAAAQDLARELGLDSRARFVRSDLYDARAAIPEPASFDLVYVTWGAINWLPDIAEWARIIAHFLKPGGALYLAEAHPGAYVFDDAAEGMNGMPGVFAPYFQAGPVEVDNPRDYVDPNARLANSRTLEFIHPLGSIIGGLLDAGLRLEWFHEHAAVTWRMFAMLVEDERGLFRWPDKPWLPLAFSLRASKP